MKKTTSLFLILCLLLTLAACGDPKDPETETIAAGETYADTLFDSSRVHTVDVEISEADWADLKANPLNKTKYKTNVTIDGERLEEVAFSTKGNTSLSFVADDPDSDRYSFKLNFGKYDKGRTYRGLNKLSLNNLYADATEMKDFLSYEIFRQVGVDAPLVSYVWLTVNGADHGLYIAVEDLSESYLDRTDRSDGVLYKPETERLDNMDKAGDRPEGGFPEGMTPPEGGFPEGMTPPEGGFPEGMNPPEGGFPEGMNPPEGGSPDGMTPPEGGFPGGMTPPEGSFPEGMTPPEGGFPEGMTPSEGGFPGGGMGFGSDANGADLKYTDDELSSYSDIFDNNETDADEEDNRRVVAALKSLSEGDSEACLDTEEIIRYFAAHNFVLNYDSYTGSMLHNYYLYENDGKLAMLPWDYNLAFGGFGGGPGSEQGNATALINTGVDTPLSGASEDDRPMWSWIVSDEASLARYHEVCDELLQTCFESGEITRRIDTLKELLLPYVQKDPSAFYTAEEFEAACGTLRSFCELRAQSIRAQLDGSLAARTDEQQAEDRIDASGLSVQSMGSQGGGPEAGGGRPGGMGFPGGPTPGTDGSQETAPEQTQGT